MARICPEDLDDYIRQAFSSRRIPLEILRMPIAGDSIPSGHPGYGLGDPIPRNDTDAIVRWIKGRRWEDVYPRDLQWAINYFNVIALAYYLPALLIFNLHNNHEVFTVELLLRGGGSHDDWRFELAEELSPDERQAIARYMREAEDIYSATEVSFWRTYGRNMLL